MKSCLLVLDAFVASLRAAYDVLVYVRSSVYRTLCMTPFVSYADYYVELSCSFHYSCFIMIDSCLCKFLNAELPLLYISMMVRPSGRGGNTPPPPEYMAGMIQQFELNRQIMENMLAQFPRPNVNQQPTQ